MSYNKKVWKSGDRITKEALNNMENGIEAAHQNSGGTGSVAIVDNLNSDSSTSALSAKQGKELNNKMPAKSIVEGGKIYLAKEDGTKLDSGTELPAGGSGTPYDDSTIKADIQTLKDSQINLVEDETSMEDIKDNEYPTLTTTDKTLIGSINEVNKQCKDAVKKTIIEGNKLYLVKADGTKLDSGTVLPTSSGTDNTIKLGNYIIQYNETDDTLDFMYTGTTTHYNIHNTLSNCSSSNSNSTIEENGVYTATITADKGCTLTGATISITMGGIDITSTAYADGKINISNVTGDIMINISAVQKQGEDSVITPTWKANTNISSTGAENTDAAAMVTDFIPVEAGYKYIVNLTSTSSTKISFWNSSKGFISRSSDYSPTGTDVQITFPSNGTATYFRVKTDENATVTRSNVNQYVIIKKVAQS